MTQLKTYVLTSRDMSEHGQPMSVIAAGGNADALRVHAGEWEADLQHLPDGAERDSFTDVCAFNWHEGEPDTDVAWWLLVDDVRYDVIAVDLVM